jgi:hypothetical protein
MCMLAQKCSCLPLGVWHILSYYTRWSLSVDGCVNAAAGMLHAFPKHCMLALSYCNAVPLTMYWTVYVVCLQTAAASPLTSMTTLLLKHARGVPNDRAGPYRVQARSEDNIQFAS